MTQIKGAKGYYGAKIKKNITNLKPDLNYVKESCGNKEIGISPPFQIYFVLR